MTDGVVELKQEIKGDVLVIRMHGRLDTITSPATERQVFDFINNGQHKVLFDCAGVDYLSSAGMRMLLSTAKKLKSLSGRLVICNVMVPVLEVLKMSGFDHVLDITKTEEEALRKF